jgi:hypothetical protein
MNEAIRGSVARILNRRDLVINRGQRHGVRKGMKFLVLNKKGEDIRDPETGDELGSLEIPKVAVRVVRVQERLSVARTYESKRKWGGSLGRMLGTDLFDSSRLVSQPETLESAEDSWAEELDESDSFVKVGDPVVQVYEPSSQST